MVDVDGVLAMFETDYIRVLNEVSGKNIIVLPSWRPQQWDYEKLLGFSKQDIAAAWEVINNPETEFWWGLDEYPHTRAAIHEINLLSLTHSWEVYYITTRTPGTGQEQTHEWLQDTGAWVPNVIVSNKPKGPVCASIGITHAIDDRDKNCVDIKRSVPGARVALLAQPWNRELQANSGEIEVCHDLVAWLKELREGR